MSLHIVIGFDDTGRAAEGEALYVGHDGDVAAKAAQDPRYARTLRLTNPRGRRWVNPLAASADDRARIAEENARKQPSSDSAPKKAASRKAPARKKSSPPKK